MTHQQQPQQHQQQQQQGDTDDELETETVSSTEDRTNEYINYAFRTILTRVGRIGGVLDDDTIAADTKIEMLKSQIIPLMCFIINEL